VKSNKEDCKRLARRGAGILRLIYEKTNGGELPVDVQGSVDEIERIFHDIIAFMILLQKQRLIKRFSLQDENKSRIAYFTKLLDESIHSFELNLQLSLYRRHTEASECMTATFHEMDHVSRERHGELLDGSKECERLLMKLLDCARFVKVSMMVFTCDTRLRTCVGSPKELAHAGRLACRNPFHR
jgi:hypothetical protein